MSKHTPGPWRASIFRRFSGTEIPTIYGAQGVEVGQALCMEDARLIAAATELLEALQLMVERFEDTEGSYGAWENEALEAARNTIAKAMGKSA